MKWRRRSSRLIEVALGIWFWRHRCVVVDSDEHHVDMMCGCGGTILVEYRRGRHANVIASRCPAGSARIWLVRRDRPPLPMARLL